MLNGFPVICGMATYPGRYLLLEQALDSLVQQVDQLHLYLNHFETIPLALAHPKIHMYHSAQHGGDRGDSGKFFASGLYGKPHYYFSVDDDLLYPPDYVKNMLIALQRHQNKVLVTLHGRYFHQFPIQSYYRSPCHFYHFLHSVDQDRQVHVGGTGVMAFHSDCFNPPMLNHPHMADIGVGIQAWLKQVPIYVISHSENWVISLPEIEKNISIMERYFLDDGLQTRLINHFFTARTQY